MTRFTRQSGIEEDARCHPARPRGLSADRALAAAGREDGPVRWGVAWTVAGGLLALVGLAVSAPWLGFAWVYDFFGVACHQRPERCFTFGEHPTALCVRCLGLYSGLVLGHLGFCAWRPGESAARRLLLLSLGLMLADVASEFLGLRPAAPFLRVVIGLLVGLACSWFTLRGLTELFLTSTHNLESRYAPDPT